MLQDSSVPCFSGGARHVHKSRCLPLSSLARGYNLETLAHSWASAVQPLLLIYIWPKGKNRWQTHLDMTWYSPSHCYSVPGTLLGARPSPSYRSSCSSRGRQSYSRWANKSIFLILMVVRLGHKIKLGHQEGFLEEAWMSWVWISTPSNWWGGQGKSAAGTGSTRGPSGSSPVLNGRNEREQAAWKGRSWEGPERQTWSGQTGAGRCSKAVVGLSPNAKLQVSV